MTFIIIRHFLNLKKLKKITKKHWQITLLLFFWITGAIVFYGSFIEPKNIIVNQIKISINKTAQVENLKVAFISDFHLGPFKKEKFLEKIIEKVSAQKPDIILLGGDFIHQKENEAKYFAPIKKMTNSALVFAVWGNHEYNVDYDDKSEFQDRTTGLKKIFLETGIQVLNNEARLLTIHGAKFYLVGLDSTDAGKGDYPKATYNLDKQIPQILLAHSPDVVLLNPATADLILSGHTHGGQIRLPLVGSLAIIPTYIGRSFDQGLFKFPTAQLFITRGLGESGSRARLFCPPEISILNIDL
ncbi:metallophosphoesterase [Candidatus Falkowbacteria bacterium]|nr:metallophosphoesterase [Candidatus Falkowbacteria bacterium]